MEVPGKKTDTYDEIDVVTGSDKLCEPCEVGNVKSQASGVCKECEEYMCAACFTQHIRVKLCRHHTLLDIDSSSESFLKIHSRATKCRQHGGELIKFYCRKHEAVGCGDCMILGHSACKSEYIKDLSSNFQQDEEYKTFMKKIDQLICDRKEFEKKIKASGKDNKRMLEKALGDIRQFRVDINKYLDKVEKDITGQVENIMKENETLLAKLENDCTILSTKLEEITNMLDSELYKDDVLFIHTVECKPKLPESEKAISSMKSNSMKKYEFVCDEQLRSLVSSAQKLGTLEISSSAIYPQTSDRAKEGSAGGNTEGNERTNIRPRAIPGGFKQEKTGVRSVVAVGARVQRNRPIMTNWRYGGYGGYGGYGYVQGTVTAVHGDGMVTVRLDDGREGRHRIGEGRDDVTLL